MNNNKTPLTEEELKEAYDEVTEIFDMNKRLAIKMIKLFDDIHFTEHLEGENVIGYIQFCDITIQVCFLEDNMGKYLKLSFKIDNIKRVDEILNDLSLRIVYGRWEIVENSIILHSLIPILDKSFLQKQIVHSLSEIWDMSFVVNHYIS
jgi:hypothetical protein